MVLSASATQARVLRDGRRLLAEADNINMLMYCISFSLVENIEKHFPGFSATFNMRFWSLGIDPYTSIITNPTKFADLLKQFFGGADQVLHYLKRALPDGEIYSKIVAAILRGDNEDGIKEALELIVAKYRKDLEKLCTRSVS